MTLQELFTDASKFTKGKIAVDKNGREINPFGEAACAWDLRGGIIKCYPNTEEMLAVQVDLANAIRQLFPDRIRYTKEKNCLPDLCVIVDFGDYSTTTFEDVMAVIARSGK